jgi:uncharacterized protein
LATVKNIATLTPVSAISRRKLLELIAGLTAARKINGAARDTAGRSRARPRVAEKVPDRCGASEFETVQLNGLLSDRMTINVNERLLRIDAQTFLAGFINRDHAGQFDGAWVGEHAGKFLDAACNALRYREQTDLRALTDKVARTLMSCQEADGYLGTYPTARRWSGWDVWVHKYNLIGLLSYYELTADAAALNACRRMGDLLCRTFGDLPGQRNLIAAGEHVGMAATSVLEPMCRLYRHTAGARHLEFCNYVVRAYDHPDGPQIVSSLLAGGGVYRTANGKAYEMLSNLNGIVDLYRITGERRLLDAVLRGWEDIVQHQLYRTGTVSAREHFQPPGSLLTLQSSNVGETCATVTWLQLNWRLLRLTGAARFGQEIERTVYNHLLAAQDPHTGNISYYTSWCGPKETTDAVLCCVSSGPRGITLIPQLAWALEEDALLVNLYIPGQVRLRTAKAVITMVSETNYPSDGHVRLTLTVDQPTRFKLRLRVPEWTTTFAAVLDGRKVTGTPGTLLDLDQTWKGDTIVEIRMDMPVKLLQGSRPYSQFVSVQRGPQVLALEKALNTDVPYMERVCLEDRAGSIQPTTAHSSAGTAAVYEIEATVGVPADAGELRYERRLVRLVPFADLRDGTVWLTRADHARHDIPAVTTFARSSLSVVTLGLERTAGRAPDTDLNEFITDENPQTFCTVDPEQPSLATYLGAPPGRRGDPVWFAIRLTAPAQISRVIYRHGAVTPDGGWFDTSRMRPQIEVTTEPMPTSSNSALPDESKIRWHQVGTLDSYPHAGGSTPPTLVAGQAFELRLAQPMMIYGLRVTGNPGGRHASCAELSAYS